MIVENTLNVQMTCDLFRFVGERIIESKPILTEVDGAIGDGDHGIGMSIGFTAAIQKLNETEMTSINDIFRTIGMSMINSMGGASGIIFGTMFTGGVKNMPVMDRIDLEALSTIMENALKAVKERGKADLGDKTMIDALQPAVATLRKYADKSASLLDALKAAEESARVGVENTKQYVSRFGRAKALGERAIGHQDAGATSVWIIFRAMAAWIENRKAVSS
ncbi:dihydroxyacetone kinase subunit DhaL [Paenibacillus sp. EPM92]|uniref:dihydroxyacetone kinase subunit DhaL n=1 Tax=Paenibacillus sp. EPM92 TaxID=1561195 RepID=UPI001915453B|nr:dihydroxyacetone kinase subunit DhaL [Paenibacillus sp. EPM92]